MSFNSFKKKYRGARLRLGTPPPITDLVEPLSPAGDLRDALPAPSTPKQPAHRKSSTTRHVSYSTQNNRDGHTARENSTFKRPEAYQSGNPGLPPIDTAYAQVHGSPMDALASAASLSASPTFAAVQRSSSVQHSPAASPYFPTYTHNNAYQDGFHHYNNERPSKRARSEAFPSPQQYQGISRPVTSHTGATGWSYNVERAVDQDAKMLQQGSSAVETHVDRPMTADEKRLFDAELLLGFTMHAARRTSSSGAPPNHLAEIRADLQAQQPGPSQAETTEVNGDVLQSRVAPTGQPTSSAIQTHTPPEDFYNHISDEDKQGTSQAIDAKTKRTSHTRAKGKSKGARNRGGSSKKSSKSATKAKGSVSVASTTVTFETSVPPPKLPLELARLTPPDNSPTEKQAAPGLFPTRMLLQNSRSLSHARRKSFTSLRVPPKEILPVARASSVPCDGRLRPDFVQELRVKAGKETALDREEPTICSECNLSETNTLSREMESWVSCNGCKEWFHFACAGFKNERQVKSVDKFHCKKCRPQHGPTTFVRRSSRAHTAVDYAGLHEGVLRTSEDTSEHHYIQKIKDGVFKFNPESFPRMRPELVTGDFLEKSGGFQEPILISASVNPRPSAAGAMPTAPTPTHAMADVEMGDADAPPEVEYEQEPAPDDGQDLLDMVIPRGLTVRHVMDLYGPEERVEVIDTKAQEGEDKRWTMRKWADYYYEEGENKAIRNVISLEVSQSKLGRLIQRPRVVRDLDLQDSVWPTEGTDVALFPRVQFYCLMSVADCYTDYHIDFGGSSVYYHILRGKKTFFFIRPTPKNLKKYEEWCVSQAQNWTWLPDQCDGAYRVDLSEGDTMLIPSGWIHAVWTPEDSLVIGGNFLTRMHYGMQIKVAEIEKNTKVPRKFRYPHFQKLLWFAVHQYLENDPLPQSVLEVFQDGDHFHREVKTHMQVNEFGHNSRPGPKNYHARYYSKRELDGLPDLVDYILRTVLVSLGRVEGISQEKRNAVSRSIPKSKGDPLETARKFAMWVAWKRGNEGIPAWAHPDAVLPGVDSAQGEKKLSVAAIKRMAREQAQITPDRQSARQRDKAAETAAKAQEIVIEVNEDGSQPTITGKTSVLGPKRIACDACRKRRIRCKHKEEVSSIPLPAPPPPIRNSAIGSQMVAHVIPQTPQAEPAQPVPNELVESLAALPANSSRSQVKALLSNFSPVGESGQSSTDNRPRNKACIDCRKSKRRCIHDEGGNIDPIKAAQPPVPRGTTSNKKRRSTGDADGLQPPKKAKVERTMSLDGTSNSAGLFDVMPADPVLDDAHYQQELDVVHVQPRQPAPVAPMFAPTASNQSAASDLAQAALQLAPSVSVADISMPDAPSGMALGQDVPYQNMYGDAQGAAVGSLPYYTTGTDDGFASFVEQDMSAADIAALQAGIADNWGAIDEQQTGGTELTMADEPATNNIEATTEAAAALEGSIKHDGSELADLLNGATAPEGIASAKVEESINYVIEQGPVAAPNETNEVAEEAVEAPVDNMLPPPLNTGDHPAETTLTDNEEPQHLIREASVARVEINDQPTSQPTSSEAPVLTNGIHVEEQALQEVSSPLSVRSRSPTPTPHEQPQTNGEHVILPSKEQPPSRRQSSRVSAPVDRFSATPFETPSKPQTNGVRRTKTPATPSSTNGVHVNGVRKGKSASPTTTRKTSTTPKSRRQSSVTHDNRRDSKVPKTNDIFSGLVKEEGGAVQAPSHEETEDEASLRLIRELQAGDFGMRRRAR